MLAIKYKSLNNRYLTVYSVKVEIDMEKYGEKLFSLGARFHRLDKGNGLGLYMTLRQLEALKGKIHVDSKENEGSTFIVELPL